MVTVVVGVLVLAALGFVLHLSRRQKKPAPEELGQAMDELEKRLVRKLGNLNGVARSAVFQEIRRQSLDRGRWDVERAAMVLESAPTLASDLEENYRIMLNESPTHDFQMKERLELAVEYWCELFPWVGAQVHEASYDRSALAALFAAEIVARGLSDHSPALEVEDLQALLLEHEELIDNYEKACELVEDLVEQRTTGGAELRGMGELIRQQVARSLPARSRVSSDADEDAQEIRWIEAEDNPWGVPILDVRPITLHMLSTSRDPQCATNAVSFGQDDGTGFIGQDPPSGRTVKTVLRFKVDRMLADGVLFAPREMEHKWAIFCHAKRLLFVRSWLRKVQVVADFEPQGHDIQISTVRGAFVADDESPEYTVRVLDFLLRTHVLELPYPAPLPTGAATDTREAALWCMSTFGNRAWYAAEKPIERSVPDKPLRSNSMLHVSVAKGDIATIEKHLADGVPADLLAADGLAPLHWALASKDPRVIDLLVSRGSSVDVRSDEGATPLMLAAQGDNAGGLAVLMEHGADVNAVDNKGFSALHRAAEGGRVEMVAALLSREASSNVEAGGMTPQSLATKRGHSTVVELLARHAS